MDVGACLTVKRRVLLNPWAYLDLGPRILSRCLPRDAPGRDPLHPRCRDKPGLRPGIGVQITCPMRTRSSRHRHVVPTGNPLRCSFVLSDPRCVERRCRKARRREASRMRFTNPFGKRGHSSRSRRSNPVRPPDQFQGRPVYRSLEEWDRRVVELVGCLPWFGQDVPPLTARRRRRRRGEPLPPEDHNATSRSTAALSPSLL